MTSSLCPYLQSFNDDLPAYAFRNTTLFSETQQSVSRLNRITYAYISPVIISFGIVGDILTVATLTHPLLRRNSIIYTYLTLLAMTDLLTHISVIPMILWLLNMRLCSETSAFYYAHIGFPLPLRTLLGIVLFIVCWLLQLAVFIARFRIRLSIFLTMSQYMAVCYPFNHGYIRKRKTCFMLFALAYVFNFCIYAPWATKKKIFTIPRGLSQCPYVVCDRGPNETWFLIYEWVREFLTRVFPFLLIAYFNVKILITYRNTKRDRMLRLTYSSHTRLLSEKNEQEEKRLFVLLFAIIIVFFLCTIPAAPLTIFVADKRSENLSFQIIRAVINLMEFTKFALNFYFYCLINPDIRRICLYIIQCRKSNAKVARVKGQPVNPISLYTRSTKSTIRGLTPISGASRRNSQTDNGGGGGGGGGSFHQHLFLRTRSANALTSVLSNENAMYDQLTVIKESDDSDPARDSNSPLSVGESL